MVVADPSSLKGIPELFETEAGESLIARTESLATFRELGPPDLCRIEKYNAKSNGPKEISSYHYVLGVDSSSSASVAAYLNSLSYALVSPNPKTPNPWKIRSGTYCCFNAFSRVDVRVEVRIPGGVESYVVDLRGDKHPITNPAVWQETFVCAVLRSILDDNDEPDGNDGNPIMGLRKMDPLDTRNAEKRFLEAAASEFWKGWLLGTIPEIQNATPFSNHLTNGILKYFKDAGRLNQAAAFFEPLFAKDAEVGAVLAASYFGNDNEVKGVKVLYESLKKNPSSYGLLMAQVDFLIGKNKLDMAANLAKMAVVACPSEYITWAKLTEVYIKMGDIESALLTLNSCPMFAYCERDAHRMPVPARIHLPLRPDPKPEDMLPSGGNPTSSTATSAAAAAASSASNLSGTIEDENDPRENQIHPELARLPAVSLRGTFLMAYNLLIQIVSKTGWDELLKFRSRVFVMEEEYRIHRALMEESRKEEHDEEGDSLRGRAEETGNVDDSVDGPDGDSGNGPHVSPLSKARVAVNGVITHGNGSDGGRDDSDENRLQELENFETIRLTPDPADATSPESPSGKKGLSIDEMLRRASDQAHDDDEDLDVDEKSAHTGVDKMGSLEGARTMTSTPNPRPKRNPINFKFRNKRLCEKWLDNLFMVLYNDLRLYTALKQEMGQYNQATNKPPLAFRKTGAEWEIYGDLSERLHHLEDAKIAYKMCIDQKFSIKSWLKILAMESNEGNIREALIAVNKVIVLLDKSYIDNTYPSPIARGIFKLIGRHGYQKVHNVLIALNVPQRNFKLIMKFFE
ncbi:Chs5p-Arf1p-binding proteins-domain-containing protein [Obelidium mucronatum]|nr:Chs5p-Arf1p-binding proteins-domain-containing protein [Obelidium mucronatum]